LEFTMPPATTTTLTAFAGAQILAAGLLPAVLAQVHAALQRIPELAVLIFDDATGQQLDFDFRGTVGDVLARLEATGPLLVAHPPEPPAGTDTVATVAVTRGAGRPQLGVVAREVTLLPRHWDWLAAQTGGASVALRKLVDAARRDSGASDLARASQQACYRFISAMAGNLPGFEEATRALFACDAERFRGQTLAWPPDVRDHAWRLGAAAFSGQA
jgi:uncharacterized protein